MTASSSQVVARVVRLLSEETRVPVSEIGESSSLSDDLGLDGDDAVRVIEQYAEEFRVDLSGFEFRAYFGSEGFDWAGLYRRFVRGHKRRRLLVTDLVRGAERGFLGNASGGHE